LEFVLGILNILTKSLKYKMKLRQLPREFDLFIKEFLKEFSTEFKEMLQEEKSNDMYEDIFEKTTFYKNLLEFFNDFCPETNIRLSLNF
jgi:hypothetical protein